jgi:hypothetical protein
VRACGNYLYTLVFVDSMFLVLPVTGGMGARSGTVNKLLGSTVMTMHDHDHDHDRCLVSTVNVSVT